MMQALRTTRPPRDTGPLELRDYGPSGGRLGTYEDCYEGSPWELHRGELVEQMGSQDLHAVVMALISALFRTHARRGLRTMTDVYCDLTDDLGPSVRAPDVVLVEAAGPPRGDFVRVTPILAVEVRGTQSKKYLEEKVKLYLSHDWPLVWVAHAERHELTVVTPHRGSVVYRPGTEVPLPPELDRYGLRAIPADALFDDTIADRYADGWAQKDGELRTLSRLFERKLGRPLSGADRDALRRALDTREAGELTDAALDLAPAALAAWLADLPRG